MICHCLDAGEVAAIMAIILGLGLVIWALFTWR